MVIDTSAVLAVLFQEPDALNFANAIGDADITLISAASILEASIVAESRAGPQGVIELDMLIGDANMEIAPFDEDHLRHARTAYRAYGKGRHPAGLNFGDCMVYGLARATGEPVLCKGSDFAQTDIALVSL